MLLPGLSLIDLVTDCIIDSLQVLSWTKQLSLRFLNLHSVIYCSGLPTVLPISLVLRNVLIIKIPWQFIKHRDEHNKGAFTFINVGRKYSRLDPSYQRHITFACTGIITPIYRLYQFTDHKGMDSLVNWGKMYARNLCPRLLHNWIQRHEKEMNPGCRVQDQFITINQSCRKVKATKLFSERAGWLGNQTPDTLHQQPVA